MRHFRRLARGQPPDSPADRDERVLGALREAGAELARPREIRHYLYFDSEHSAREGARHVAADDARSRCDPARTDEHGWCS